jgi:hypothetical protein
VTAETRYAKSGDVHIAYQVIGDGPVDLVFVSGWITHVELGWDDSPRITCRGSASRVRCSARSRSS